MVIEESTECCVWSCGIGVGGGCVVDPDKDPNGKEPGAMVNMILHGSFTEDYLTSHTVSEATKTKQPLPKEKVQVIIGTLVNVSAIAKNVIK